MPCQPRPLPGKRSYRTSLLLCLVLGTATAAAETTLPGTGEPAESATGILPPPPIQDDRLSSLPGIEVKRFRFEGNTIFTDDELHALVTQWEGRFITASELRDVQARLTRHYTENGYAISGAMLPDQSVANGIVTLRIQEGGITAIELQGNRHLRERYITDRLATARPLQIAELENSIQLLQRDPMVKQINAQVAPAPVAGEGVLRVHVKEEDPFSASLVLDNSRPPAIGAYQLGVHASHGSLLGFGDRLNLEYRVHEGPDSYGAGYALPLNARNTQLLLAWEDNDTVVVEAPFSAIDIESVFNRAEIGIRHPLLKTLKRELALSLGLEWRQAETSLLGQPFSFAPGVVNGESRVTLVHFVQEWLDQDKDRLVAIRSDIRQGVDLFDATTHANLPDGRYLAWLGQFRWVERLSLLDSRLVLRGVGQATSDSLLPSEKFSIGGMETVRGYRENLITADTGFAVGVEWQVPVGHARIPGLSDNIGDGLLELAVFLDYGKGSNKSAVNPIEDSISSIGLGLSWQMAKKMTATVYWGHPLEDVGDPADPDLQDDGIHFVFNLGVI